MSGLNVTETSVRSSARNPTTSEKRVDQKADQSCGVLEGWERKAGLVEVSAEVTELSKPVGRRKNLIHPSGWKQSATKISEGV